MAKANVAATDSDAKGEGSDAPLLDLNEASIKKLLTRAKKRGYITYDELNEALPQDQMSSEQIEDVMSSLSEMGINIIENDEPADDPAETARAEDDEDEPEAVEGDLGTAPTVAVVKAPLDRTDDPVRMYLREMGAVELLSREGEIAIAKRIEAGRNTMIAGLCESPMTFTAMIEWSNALNEGRMQLREILDLEAMLAKDPAEAATDENGEPTEGGDLPTVQFKDDEEPAEEAAAPDEEDGMTERRMRPDGKPAIPDDDEEDTTLSLAAMEEVLKPAALEKFAEITATYKKFLKLQETRLLALNANNAFPAADERKYQKLREELTRGVQSIHFNNGKIELLVDQLYTQNRRLLTLGGQMMKLADKHKINRKAFLDDYMGNELD
ncbi:MAG: polymerase sigma factor RpoD, partial [Pseudomonadota bacterium]